MLDPTKIREKLDKVERLANDKSAPVGEREAARAQAEKLRKKMGTKRVDENRYKELVAEGKELVKQQEDSLWRLGDIAIEIEGYGRFKEYSEEINIEYRRLQEYKQAAEAFPLEIGVRPPIFTAVLLAAKSKSNKDEYLLDEKERQQEAKKGVSHRAAKRLVKEKRAKEPKPDKTTKRATKAAKKKEQSGDAASHYTEAARILHNMLTKDDAVYKLVHAVDLGATFGQVARKALLKEFQQLRARVDAEIAWLESSDKLN